MDSTLEAKINVEESSDLDKNGKTSNLIALFTSIQLLALKNSFENRKNRKTIEILIVEDQSFSRKLLAGMFMWDYKCHSAANATQAIELYALHSPEITFLDIELPDANGHEIAHLFKKNDPDSYLVMVTANNYVNDLNLAKENKVDGFIIKPFSKQRILDSIQNYFLKHPIHSKSLK